MIRKKILVLFTIFSALALGACGSSSSSSSGGGGGGGGLATGTFTKTVLLGGTSTTWATLFGPNTANRFQFLYRAKDVNGSGNINAISFRHAAINPANNCPNVTIKMGQTSLTDLTTTYDMNVQEGRGSLVTVLNDAALNLPAGATNEYFTINLATPFNYNGVDNLVVEISRTSACVGGIMDIGRTPAMMTFNAVNFSAIASAPVTGTLDTRPADAKFNFAGGENFLETTVGVDNTNAAPFNRSTAILRKVQLLYPAADVDGSGPITGIGFPVGATVVNAQTYAVTVRLAHSTLGALVSGPYADSYSSTPVTVATDLKFTVPAGTLTGSIVWLPVTGSFNYNGTDNLILEIETTDNVLAPVSVSWQNQNMTGTNSRLYGEVGGTLGVAGEEYYFAKFRFNGGTTEVITDGVTTSTDAFNGGGSGQMSLYRASDLGTTAMTINSVSCRLSDMASLASVFTNYKVIMGHTDLDELGTDPAINIPMQNVVFDGTFNLPGMIKGGDWITVDLTTPFQYDGISNLVVWMGNTAASGNTTACYMSAAVGQPNQTGVGAPDAAAITLSSSKFDMRFGVSN